MTAGTPELRRPCKRGKSALRYRVVLVDDEPWALKDFELSFPWAKYGFRIAGSFTKPREALRALANLRPELVVTDLRMPGMSGAELLQSARDAGLQSAFVLVSGVSDFEAARKAIRYGAVEYCLKPLDEAECEALLQRVCALLKAREKKEDALSPQAQALADYVDGHLHQKLTLNDLADAFHMSATSLARQFHACFGMTFGQYLEARRMDIATRLLREKRLSVSEIARQVGYADQNYFTVCFKRRLGVTPTQYAQKEWGDQP